MKIEKKKNYDKNNTKRIDTEIELCLFCTSIFSFSFIWCVVEVPTRCEIYSFLQIAAGDSMVYLRNTKNRKRNQIFW